MTDNIDYTPLLNKFKKFDGNSNVKIKIGDFIYGRELTKVEIKVIKRATAGAFDIISRTTYSSLSVLVGFKCINSIEYFLLLDELHDFMKENKIWDEHVLPF